MFISFSAATTQHIIWRWDGISPSWLLHAGGQRATQRGVEAFWGTEEELWEGEEELHRGCHPPGTRSTPAFLCSGTCLIMHYGCCSCPAFLWIFFFLPFHRKKPFKKTVLLGSRINFWTWLPLQTEGDVLCLTDKVPYQSVSLFCCCSCCFHKYFTQ